MSFLPYAVAVWLFLIGLYGMVTSRNLIHMVICLVVAQSSTDLLLLAIGYHAGAGAPVFANMPLKTPAVASKPSRNPLVARIVAMRVC